MPPAARASDMHVCPQVTVLVPHVGGPILPPCCPTVLIGFLPAARVTDMLTCVGPPDIIAKGSPTVLIGGLMAARVGDITAHGGNIILGCFTVLIGEAGMGSVGMSPPAPAEGGAPPSAPATSPPIIEEAYSKGIEIKGTKEFIETTKDHLDNIGKTPTGKKLLESLAESGKTTTIIQTSGGNEAPPKNFKAALAKGSTLKWEDSSKKEHSLTGDGSGSDTTVKYNPDRKSIGKGKEDWQTRPPEVGLAHELVHADDAAHGKMDGEKKDGVYNYERQAVGLPPYEDKAISENKIRSEWDPTQTARPRY